jgi:hypothetical protein
MKVWQEVRLSTYGFERLNGVAKYFKRKYITLDTFGIDKLY